MKTSIIFMLSTVWYSVRSSKPEKSDMACREIEGDDSDGEYGNRSFNLVGMLLF